MGSNKNIAGFKHQIVTNINQIVQIHDFLPKSRQLRAACAPVNEQK